MIRTSVDTLHYLFVPGPVLCPFIDARSRFSDILYHSILAFVAYTLWVANKLLGEGIGGFGVHGEVCFHDCVTFVA